MHLTILAQLFVGNLQADGESPDITHPSEGWQVWRHPPGSYSLAQSIAGLTSLGGHLVTASRRPPARCPFSPNGLAATVRQLAKRERWSLGPKSPLLQTGQTSGLSQRKLYNPATGCRVKGKR